MGRLRSGEARRAPGRRARVWPRSAGPNGAVAHFYCEWRTPGGRDLTPAYLLPRAESALRAEVPRLADAKNARGSKRVVAEPHARALSDLSCELEPVMERGACELKPVMNRAACELKPVSSRAASSPFSPSVLS